MFDVADTVAGAIHTTWRDIRHQDWVPLGVREQTVELTVRRPTAAEVQAAREVLQRAPQGPLRTLPEIYARETVQLAANNGAHALHGGLQGFDRQLWQIAEIENGAKPGATLILRITEPPGPSSRDWLSCQTRSRM